MLYFVHSFERNKLCIVFVYEILWSSMCTNQLQPRSNFPCCLKSSGSCVVSIGYSAHWFWAELESHRMVWVEGTLKIISLQSPAMGWDTFYRMGTPVPSRHSQAGGAGSAPTPSTRGEGEGSCGTEQIRSRDVAGLRVSALPGASWPLPTLEPPEQCPVQQLGWRLLTCLTQGRHQKKCE